MDKRSSKTEAIAGAALSEQAASSGEAAARAYADLAALLEEIEAGYYGPDRRRMATPEERAAGRYLVASVLIGVAAWVPAHELNVAQQWLLGTPHSVVESATRLAETLATMPTGVVLLLIAFIPAVCEELLFRGFLLSALGSGAGRWTSILVAAAVFGVFHFFVFKFAVTAGLGIVLGLLCWQSRSIVPAIVAHFLHNAIGAYSIVNPDLQRWLGISQEAEWPHLPMHILIPGGLIFLLGLLITSRPAKATTEQALPAIADG